MNDIPETQINTNIKTTIESTLPTTQTISNIDKNIKRIQMEIDSYKKMNERQSKDLMKNVREKISKESLILSLEKDLEYHKNNNRNFKEYKEYADKLVKEFEINRNKIIKYKEEMDFELRDFISQCKDYENERQEILDEQEILVRSSEALIFQKKEEQESLNNNLKKICKDISEQSKELERVNSILSDLKNQIEQKNAQFEIDEKNNIDEYDQLLANFKSLQKRFNYLQEIENQKEKKKEDDDIKKRDDEKKEIEVDLRVKDKEIKEQYLKTVIGDLNRKMEELKNQKHKSELEKERIRFLGKALAGKLREKKEINDKIQQQNQNNKQKKNKNKPNELKFTNYADDINQFL